MVTHRNDQTIAIVGGGLAGTLVSVALLRSRRFRGSVVLVERRGRVGRGVAYSTPCVDHRLNVPAGRMSALEDEPDHFVRWLRQEAGRLGGPVQPGPSDFVSRRLYGQYIEHVLEGAVAGSGSPSRFSRVNAEAVGVEVRGDGGTVVLADGGRIDADWVVLAVGLPPGEYPVRTPLAAYESWRYVHDPWSSDALAGIRRGDDVLVVGQGLTAIDMIIELGVVARHGVVHAVSRRGQRPAVHLPAGSWPAWWSDGSWPAGPRQALAELRSQLDAAAAVGVDWRAVIDAIRPQSQAIWSSWTWDQRARFLRVVRPLWDLHRHRIPPETAARVTRRERDGHVVFHAGRMLAFEERGDCIRATFKDRRTGGVVELDVAKVINCTGPRRGYSKYADPLLAALLYEGLIAHDPLTLGLAALPTGALLDADGNASDWLFTIGATLRGVLWECTAVPEIRRHAAALATSFTTVAPTLQAPIGP